MASNWEKPGFEVMTVGAECTAYSGSQVAMQRPVVEPAAGVVAGETLSRCDNSASELSAADKDTRPRN
jgi:hypothetical protein